MIVPIIGNVKYPITLDPSVWIFDNRKIKFENAFKTGIETLEAEEELTAAEQFNREIFQFTNENPPINKFDSEEILKNSYVMPIKSFLETAEVHKNAASATILQKDGNAQEIPFETLYDALLLFSWKGKPLKDGPVHLYFRNGSNFSNPIKQVNKIKIK